MYVKVGFNAIAKAAKTMVRESFFVFTWFALLVVQCRR